MASVNKVILLGNLGRDPELKYTTSGMAVVNLSIATTSGGGRDREPQTEWHRVVVYDKQAELCNQYLVKGRQVYIEGRITYRSYDDKQSGQKRYTTEIVANQVVFLGGGERGAGDRPMGDRPAGPPRSAGRGGDNFDQGNQWQGGRGGNAPARGGYDGGPDDMPAPSFPDDDDIPF